MHEQAAAFMRFVQRSLPQFFRNAVVLDVGAGDINGNNRGLFADCDYTGNDVSAAPNVTVVCRTSQLEMADGHFNTIVSTECFEHDPEYAASLRNIVRMLRPGGLLAFTCASVGRMEHGTRRMLADHSFGTIAGLGDMQDYYKNLTIEDVGAALDLNSIFGATWASYYNQKSQDLYFVGVKRSSSPLVPVLPRYTAASVVDTTERHRGQSADSVSAIFDRCGTDKNSYFHNYGRQYNDLVQKFRALPLRFLEIGVKGGESLKAWRDIFPNAVAIVGMDIDSSCKKTESPEQKIFVEIGDATDSAVISAVNAKYGPFDLIVDDGSHINRDVIRSFELLFPLLRDDGLYIVEDTVTFEHSGFRDPNYPTHLEFFCKYLPQLNRCRINAADGPRDWCVDPFKIIRTTDDPLEYGIDSILFGVSFVAIAKKLRLHWMSTQSFNKEFGRRALISADSQFYWGCGQNTLNVTSAVRSALRAGGPVIAANQQLGCDPCIGYVKQLSITTPGTDALTLKENEIVNFYSSEELSVQEVEKCYIYFHICQIGPWQEIVTGIFALITSSGLLERADELCLGVLGDSPDAVLALLANHPKVRIVASSPDLATYERLTLRKLHERAQQEKFKVLYLHSKGVYRIQQVPDTAAPVKAWTRYLLYWTVEQWRACVRTLDLVSAVGTEWLTGHYRGNFWWANSSYIATLPPAIGPNYTDPEFWISLGTPTGKLFNFMNSNIYPYTDVIPPELYRKETSEIRGTITWLSDHSVTHAWISK